MGLRWHLEQIEKNSCLSDAVRKEVKEMFEEVSQISKD